MTTAPAEDEFTELVDADFSRVDLVGKGANGIPRFLIAKQDGESAGLMEPEFVRDLIAKAEPESAPAVRDDVTMTGSPAAIAKLIHGAPVAKAKNDTASRKHDAATGAAMPDGSYPIENEADLTKAIHAVGRGGASHDAIRHHIISRARSLGASSKIPDNWNSDGSLKGDSVSKSDTVTKADMGPDLDDGVDGMDPTVPLAAPDEMGPGDPTDPGSPAWESIDAATAQKWTSIAVRLKNALCVMSEREMIEAASADPDDADAAWDLQDAMCAVDYVIDTLAGFAVGEQAEADLATEAMDAIGKALAGFDPSPLDCFEGLVSVAKAGRVLSSANEAAIRSAAQSLQNVLMSLPSAPAADEPVTKEEAAMPADESPQATPEAVEKAEDTSTPEPVTKDGHAAPEAAETVAKEDGEKPAMQAVFDQDGQLIGIVDPTAITPVSGAGGKPAEDEKPDDAGDDADPADAADMTPAPAADAGTSADAVTDDVTKAGQETITITQDALESLITKSVAAALGAQPPAEDVAKQADVVRELGEQVETLKAQVVTLGEQPAMPKVFTNGAVPPPGTLRGQDQAPQGGTVVDVAKAQELKHTLYTGSAQEQNKAFTEMQEMAVAQLAAIQRR